MSAEGYCWRCGTVVTTSHSAPECNARYDAKYQDATTAAMWQHRAMEAEAQVTRIREFIDAEAHCATHGAERDSDCNECRVVIEIETYDEVLRAALDGSES